MQNLGGRSKAAVHATRSTPKKDNRVLREALSRSRVATTAFIKAFSGREKASQQSRTEAGSESQLTEAQVRGPRNALLIRQTRSEYVASLDRALGKIPGSSLDLIITGAKEDDNLYPAHIDRILEDTFYLGKYLPCNCDGRAGYMCPLNKYLCALRLDRRLTPHCDEVEYFFDTVFARRDEEILRWSIIRLQISKEIECELSEAESTDTGAAATSSSRLEDFCNLVKEDLGPSCIPLRFKGNEPNHSVHHLNVLPPGILLGCGPAIPLQQALEDSELSAARRLVLAYLVAKSFWQFYQSDWMRTNWNLRTIQFLPNAAEYSGLSFDPLAPFLDFQTPDLLPTVAKESENDWRYVHRHPRILILGLLLFQICSGLRYDTKISAQLSFKSVNEDCGHFSNFKDETWPGLDLNNHHVSKLKAIVAECFPHDDSKREGGLLSPNLDVPARRALLRKKVVVPLHGLLKGMGLFDQNDNIRLPTLQYIQRSVDKIGGSEADIAEAQEWLKKIHGSWLRKSIIAKFKQTAGGGYNPRGLVVLPRPKIAILDTGYDPTSSFLTYALKKSLNGHWKDFWEEDLGAPKDDDGHGTSMLSLICDIAPFVDIYVARIAGGSHDLLTQREKTSGNLAKAIEWAAGQQVDVVSMSLGWNKEVKVGGESVVSNAIHKSLGYRNQKLLFFAAASNFGGGNPEMFPATHGNVFSIRATESSGHHPHWNAPLSRYDPFVFGTLGYRVPTAQRGGTQIPIVRTGTSVATAIAAGMAALILGYVNTSPRGQSWGGVRKYSGMRSVLEALSEEPEVKKRFITPEKFPSTEDDVQEFEAHLTWGRN